MNQFYTLIKKDVPALVSGDSLYNKDITETDDGINYNYTYTYRNNIDKARVINECFENHYIDETDEYYNIKLSGGFYCLYSNKIDINVISNYEVLNNNAKKVSKTVKYEEPTKAKTFSTFQIIGFVVFAILTIVTYFLYRKKNSGKV